MSNPLHNFEIHLNADWCLTLNAPVVDGQAVDMEGEDWGGWSMEIKNTIDDAAIRLTVGETATANGSVIAVAAGGATANLTVKEEDLDSVGRGERHYNLFFTYASKTYMILHGELDIEG